MNKIINFQFEFCVGIYGICIYNLVERGHAGESVDIINEDMEICGLSDWAEGLPELRSLSEGVYHVEGQAKATEDDLEYFDVRVTPSRWLSGNELNPPLPDKI